MEVANSEFTNLAAMARVSWHEGRFEGGLNIRDKALHMQWAIRESDQEQILLRRSIWRSWYSSTFAINISQSLTYLQEKGHQPQLGRAVYTYGETGLRR